MSIAFYVYIAGYLKEVFVRYSWSGAKKFDTKCPSQLLHHPIGTLTRMASNLITSMCTIRSGYCLSVNLTILQNRGY